MNKIRTWHLSGADRIALFLFIPDKVMFPENADDEKYYRSFVRRGLAERSRSRFGFKLTELGKLVRRKAIKNILM